MKILGVDPGSQNLGFGMIEVKNRRISYLTSGVISPPSKLLFYERLKDINLNFQSLLAQCRPDEVVLERMFFAKNASVALKLGEIRGVVISKVFSADIPFCEYSVKEVKKHISGYGNASKQQMQEMVKIHLSLSDLLSEDASDAISLAIYRANFLV